MPVRNRFLCACSLLSTLLLCPAAMAATEYIFTAPPRESGENESETYQPIADYLSRVTGKKIVYQHSDNWLSYQDKMRKGAYDLIFDGPHFVSWRMAHLKHVPLAKLPGKLAFVVVVRKDNKQVHEVRDLAGRSVCGLAPPNLATLTLYGQFDNPARQPLVREVRSFELAYESVVSGQCMAAVMRDQLLDKLDKGKDAVRAVYRSPGVPNQAFSAGPRFSTEEKNKIAESLLSPEARKQLPQFFGRYSKEKELMPAQDSEFRDLVILLKDSWGF